VIDSFLNTAFANTALIAILLIFLANFF